MNKVYSDLRVSWSVIEAKTAQSADAFQASEVRFESSCTQEAHGRPGRTGAWSVGAVFGLDKQGGAF
ncbi:hypothetical protein CKO36_10370 [Rhabdochromatium marinum]|nr:hypothetical protein [Rhabdochromatium marinum]